MSKRNENRPGYKKTKLGWVPEDWDCIRFKNCCSIEQGQANPNKKEYRDYYHIGPENIESNTGRIFGVKTTEELGLRSGKYLFDSDSIVYSKIRPNLNKACMPSFKGLCSAYCYPIWPLDNSAKQYIFHYMLSEMFLRQSIPVSLRTGMPKINRNDLNFLYIILPSVVEQKKIAEILSTWDIVIEQLRKLIDAKRCYLKALIQQLIIKRWQSSSTKSWQSLRAKEIFEVRSIRNRDNESVLSVTQNEGVVPRYSLDRKIEASEANLHSYELVEPGDFIISLRSFQGGIEYSKYRGIVSPAYHVIRPKRKIDYSFYKYLFKSQDFISRLSVDVIGIRDGKQINYGDFSFIQLPYPSLKEQEHIGKILSMLDFEILLVEKNSKPWKNKNAA